MPGDRIDRPDPKHMGRREARHAPVRSTCEGTRACAGRRKTIAAAGRDFIARSRAPRVIDWVRVLAVSMADAGRMHLRPCARGGESHLGGVVTKSAGMHPRAGSSRRTRSSREALLASCRRTTSGPHHGERVLRASIRGVATTTEAHDATSSTLRRVTRQKVPRRSHRTLQPSVRGLRLTPVVNGYRARARSPDAIARSGSRSDRATRRDKGCQRSV